MINFAQSALGRRQYSDVVNAFRARVLADGGTFEGAECLRQEVNVLGNFYTLFNYILTPNGYKANKMYALKPTNGDGDLAFTRATVATRRKGDNDVEAVASGVPRLNHRLGQSCAEYRNEQGPRTNLCLRSEEIDNATWTKTNCTVSANSVPGPGTGMADAVFETVTNGQHRIEQAITKAASVLEYVYTCHVKPNGRDWIYISLRNGGNGTNVWFNISTITRGTVANFGTTFIWVSYRMEDIGDGWVRIVLRVNSNATTGLTMIVASALGNGLSADFAGDITKGFYIWGTQLEQALTDTTYIPTTSASVTRNAEVITNKTGVSSYLGSVQGTIYFKGYMTFDGVGRRICITDGTSAKRIMLIFGTDNKVRLYIENTTVQVDFTVADVFRSDSEFRVVVKYALNSVKVFWNGILVHTDTVATIPNGLDRITFDDSATVFYGSIKVLAFSNVALTDDQALRLSTPVNYPTVLKNPITMTLTGNPDYYAFGNGIDLSDFFPDYSIYIAKRGPSHYLDGGNMFGSIYNAKFNLWSSVFEIIDDGSTFYSGVSAGIVGNRIFIQVARYTVSGGVDTFFDIGYLTSVDLTTLTSAEDLRLSSSWGSFTALPAPAYPRYEAYGKIQPSITTPGKHFGPHFEHNGVNHRLKVRKIIETTPGNYTITDIQVYDGLLDLGEPWIINTGGSNWLLFARQNAGTEMIYLFSSTDDCETWTPIGETNLGSSSGDCIGDAIFYNGLVHVIFQDRGTGFMYFSRNNTAAQCLLLALNTPELYDNNSANDSLGGLGYPSIWEIRPGVFMTTYCKETSTTEAHVYWTLDQLT